MVTLQLSQIRVLPGQRVLLENVSWREFQSILQELGEHRATRLSYSRGRLEIVAPLPEHEKAKVILGDLLKALLEELNMNWESFGSTTFQREDMKAGIEPDDCFYIQNHALMIGKDRIDLTVDPPPDLAIEVDVTSKTKLSAYESLQVPEIWRYQNRKLQINLLQNGKYVESSISLIVPNLPVLEGIAQFLEMSRVAGTSSALRGFRQWVRDHL